MPKNKKPVGATTIIDRAKLESLLNERMKTLEIAEKNQANLQTALGKTNEQVVGLRHRINEINELLK
jgi:hypothetical protein